MGNKSNASTTTADSSTEVASESSGDQTTETLGEFVTGRVIVGDGEPTNDAAKAAPVPGDHDYDWSQHYPEGTKLYRYIYPDGQVVAIRRFGDIYSKQWLRSIKHLEIEFDIESAAIDRAACDAARDLIDARPCPVDGPDDFHELWKAWTSASSGADDDKAVSAGE